MPIIELVQNYLSLFWYVLIGSIILVSIISIIFARISNSISKVNRVNRPLRFFNQISLSIVFLYSILFGLIICIQISGAIVASKIVEDNGSQLVQNVLNQSIIVSNVDLINNKLQPGDLKSFVSKLKSYEPGQSKKIETKIANKLTSNLVESFVLQLEVILKYESSEIQVSLLDLIDNTWNEIHNDLRRSFNKFIFAKTLFLFFQLVMLFFIHFIVVMTVKSINSRIPKATSKLKMQKKKLITNKTYREKAYKICPLCQSIMYIRIPQKGKYKGNKIIVCSKYPDCKKIYLVRPKMNRPNT